MAEETRHAAWHQETKSFAVTLVPEQGPPETLASELTDYLDAIDFAIEWLSREEVGRDETASLAILQTHAGATEKVWGYPPERPAERQELQQTFGFDPVNWRSAAPEFSARERRRPTIHD